MKLKSLAKIFGGIIALVIVALLVVPLFISAEFLKAQLMTQVKAATGRELQIKGNTSLTLFPNIAVSAEDVTLGNPAGFKSPYLVHLAKLETGAALRPLLSGNLDITGLTLEGASINLEQTASGAKNWEFTSEKLKDAAQENSDKAQAQPKAASKRTIAVGDISIRKSDITYRVAGKPDMVVKNITLLLSGADGNGPLKLSGALDYKGETARVELGIDESRTFLAGDASPLSTKLTLPGGAIQFAGNASLKDGATLDGNLETVIDSLPGLMGWATGKTPGAGLPQAVRVQTKLAVRGPKSIALNELAAKIDGISATGKLAVDMKGAVPAITGALQFAELNLDALGGGKPAGSNNGGGSSSASAPLDTGWSTAPIDASGLRAANADLALKIGKLRSGKIEVNDIAAQLVLKNGVMRLNLTNAALYGGNAKGTVSIDGSGTGAGIGSDIALSGIQIDPLMTALSGASKLTGTANIALNLHGSGASQRSIVGALGGNGSVKVTDGAIKGINLAQFLREARKGFLFADNSSQKTDFSELGLTFTIAQGIVTNKDFQMKAPIVSAKGEGTVNLPAKSVNYRLIPVVAGNIKGQGGDAIGGLEIPLLITGPWSNPSVTPDLAGALQKGLQDPAALKQNIQGIKDTIGKYNSPKDIGKALLGGGNEAAPVPATTPGAAPAPAPKPSKNDAILQGVGGLLQGLQKK
ncbi:MAG: AsmA family protein [Rickettsiales bacterium]